MKKSLARSKHPVKCGQQAYPRNLRAGIVPDRDYTDVQGFEVFTSSLFCGFSGNLDFNYQSNLRNLNIDNVFVCLIAFDGLFVTRNVDIFRRNYQFTPSNMYVILLAVPFVQRYA